MSKTPLQNFAALENRYYLEAELVAQTGLRVGAGKRSDMAATDQPVIRDAFGRPFIPGSSLKGAMRSWMEKVLRGIDRRPQLWSCDPFSKTHSCGSLARSVDAAGRVQMKEDEDVRAAMCTACSMFGSTAYAGRIYFQDLPLLTDSRLVELRDGVGIDRVLGTASPGIKYDTEVVAPGSRFRLKVVAENLDPLRLALVVIGFQRLASGEIPLGGMTTRGLGQVAIKKLELKRTTAVDLLAGKEAAACSWTEQHDAAVKELETTLAYAGERHASP